MFLNFNCLRNLLPVDIVWKQSYYESLFLFCHSIYTDIGISS